MRRPWATIALMFSAFCATAPLLGPAAHADEAAALAALRQGGHVALMRHTDAPGGAGDPPGFTLEDCATQRNLSDRGRRDAGAIGQRLKAADITFAKVLSSPWCRCLDTARLMQAGNVEIAQTVSNAFAQRDRREALTEGARQIVAGWRGPGSLLIVTHGANIQPLVGYNPREGEIVVVPGGGADVREVGRIAPPSR